MNRKTVPLQSGKTLEVTCAEPPLSEGEAVEFSKFVGRFLREDQLQSMLLGQFSTEAAFAAGIGRVDGDLVGTCWAGWGRGFPSIAVMGGVATDEAWRGQGIGSTMVAACCECFDRAGGRLLLLGTTNPFAERIYARLGFRRLAGHTFYRATAGARIDEGFAPGHAVRARSASWRDMAVIAPLYLLPHPAVVMDTGTGLASSSSEEPWRCVRIFWDLLASAANGGRWEVLENDAGWIVASALARPCLGVSPPVFSLDFVWHPAYSTEGRRFVADVAARQEAETGRPVEMFVVHGDRWKRGEVERLGFHFAGRIGTTIALGGQPAPLERFKRVQSVKG